jgi:hypothetical protein
MMGYHSAIDVQFSVELILSRSKSNMVAMMPAFQIDAF